MRGTVDPELAQDPAHAQAAGAEPPFHLALTGIRSLLVLSNDALERLHSDHPRLAASLYRAAAEALAAQYRWTAAENPAVTR